MKKGLYIILLLVVVANFLQAAIIKEEVTKENVDYIIKKSFDMWRGEESSIAVMTMRVVRPDRNEEMTLRSWSKGDDYSISKFIAPAKYKGQSILVDHDSMWTYSAKSRRSIKISNSIKSKPWMGSDMSYDDISISLESLRQYTYTLLAKEKKGNDIVYVIQAVPYKNAPIVWGKEIYRIRKSDNAMLSKEFYDQSGKLIRRFDALEITYYKNDKTKPLMKHMRVTNLEKEGYYTEFVMNEVELDVEIKSSIFTLANLERP